MVFMGAFLSGDEMSPSITPTNIGDLNSVTIKNGNYDDLLATKDVEFVPFGEISDEWDFNTILHAKYDTNLNGGNVDFTFDTVSHLVIKRKRDGSNKWITVYVRELDPYSTVSLEDQLNIQGEDITPGYATYQYAAVGVLNGSESTYAIAKTYDEDTGITLDYTPVKVENLVIMDNHEMYSTPLVYSGMTATTNTSTNIITTLNEKYPTVVRNSRYNYESIEVSGIFLPTEDDGCNLMFDGSLRLAQYTRDFKEWLADEHAKLLKSDNGNVWLVYVNTGITDAPYDPKTSDLRQISFTCEEIGNYENESDLYNAGLLNETVTSEWWNS